MASTQTRSEKWLVESPLTIDLGVIRTVKAGLVAGQLDIVAHDEPTARVEVHSVSGKPLRVSVEGDALRIDHAEFRWDNLIESLKAVVGRAKADVSIVVPRTAAVTLGTVSADALVSGLGADVSLSTVSGELAVDGVTGDARLDSVSGEISVQGHRGAVNAHTVSGDITASGELRRFSSDGVSGEVFLDVTGTPDTIKVNTVSGSVTARLGEEAPTSYSIATVGGRIRLGDQELRGIRGQLTGRHGVLEKHWLDLRVNTVGGNVSILRSAGAPTGGADSAEGTGA